MKRRLTARVIVAGDARFARAGVSADINARARPFGPRFDMGAYEMAVTRAFVPVALLKLGARLAGRGAEFGRLAAHPRVRRARQHAVLGGDPALALAAQEPGHAFFDGGRDEHPRVAEFDQHGTFRVPGKPARDADRTQLVWRSATWSQGRLREVGK